MDSIYGQLNRKDTEDEYLCKSKKWMKSDFDDRVKDYPKLPNGSYIIT